MLLVHSIQNIFYLTGHQTTGIANYHCLVVPNSGDPYLILRRLELLGAQKYSWLDDFSIWSDHEDPADVTVAAIRERGFSKGVVGIDQTSSYLSVHTHRKLTGGLPGATFVDAAGVVEELRRKKSPAEIEFIRKAADITVKGMVAAAGEARAGRTENDVAAAAVSAMYRAGGEYQAREPTVNSGPRSGIPHTTFQRRVLRAGDAMILEMSGCYNRYCAPQLRTVSIGKPSDDVKRTHDACVAALGASIAVAKPGALAGDVERAYSRTLSDHGFDAGKRAGYSIGIGFYPTWMEAEIIALKKDDTTVLEPGMAFHIPPVLRVADTYGAGCSESILITDDGNELLTVLNQEIFVA